MEIESRGAKCISHIMSVLICYVGNPENVVLSLPVQQVIGVLAFAPRGMTMGALAARLTAQGYLGAVKSLAMVICEGVCDEVLAVQ